MKSQLPNSNTPKYSGALQEFLNSAGAMELAQITAEDLDRLCARTHATDRQRSRLFGLWSGCHDPSPELLAVIEEITRGSQ